MVRCLEVAAVLAAGIAACAPNVHAETAQVTTEEAMVDSPQAGLKIYVRNKHSADMSRFTPERTLVIVHGATYPAETAFDLALGGTSWMDYIARRGFDVYLMDLPGYGASTRPAAMDRRRPVSRSRPPPMRCGTMRGSSTGCSRDGI
jgi:alpha-beta hydrolase superfamily lysophospholipase